MPVNLDLSHWSRPGAVRTLRALRRLGGMATTRELANLTGSMAVHSDIHSVRCLCEAEGICPADQAVEQDYVRTTERGRRIHIYTLDDRVRSALSSGWLADEPEDRTCLDTKPAATPGGRAAGLPARTTQAGTPERAGRSRSLQEVLFDMHARTPEQAQRRRR